ncbi:hypothetical protein HPB50_000375 [Hyalomma asiaticum]|uniref:Uncharacterized protein n=1 Tax=Hyalomma asiaticum TaxID=266040 RepID=A0ACB7SF46_HYAAI|nr:hypothetical protein HPB50_000375 [Hyalomma asiaticum]
MPSKRVGGPLPETDELKETNDQNDGQQVSIEPVHGKNPGPQCSDPTPQPSNLPPSLLILTQPPIPPPLPHPSVSGTTTYLLHEARLLPTTTTPSPMSIHIAQQTTRRLPRLPGQQHTRTAKVGNRTRNRASEKNLATSSTQPRSTGSPEFVVRPTGLEELHNLETVAQRKHSRRPNTSRRLPLGGRYASATSRHTSDGHRR